eukprot:13749587-Ditylum_brightwellii.AAC.1
MRQSKPESDKVSYKDLNTFVDAKVTAALKKANSHQKKKEARKVTVDTFDKFCNLKADSNNEESNPEVNALFAASNDDIDSNAYRVPREDSKSNNK